MHELPGVLTAAEVARYLKVSTSTVRRLAETGELHGVKIGRAWRFSQRSLELFLESTAA
jgi:excisionase family DNA binding protein